MFSKQDVETKSIFVLNCMKDRDLRVSNGQLLLEECVDDNKYKTLTKLPFQKLLALFIIGSIRITTPFIEKCKKYNVAVVVVKLNLRPVFYWSNSAEANFRLREVQYRMDKNDITYAKCIVENKISNQYRLLIKSRRNDSDTQFAKEEIEKVKEVLPRITAYNNLMGAEGYVSKLFFAAYFQDLNWKGRRPRLKCDVVNVTLDIGYTILFNFVECFARMFGFDIYVGVYHRLWFKRKSLICDLMEPFRCIVDRTVRKGFNRQQFKESDFILKNGEYKLKFDKCGDYYKVFFDELIVYKLDVYDYVKSFYKSMMRGGSISQFELK